ncbi:MAG: hypothetical protein AAGG68_29755 [Bacteroidota bacterium]
MKKSIILAAIAVNTFVGLLLIQLFVLHPMDRSYEDCLAQIQSQTGLEQEADIFRLYPDLKVAKSNCETVKSLRAEIEAISGGSAPNVTKEQEQLIQEKQVKMKELQARNEEIFEQIEVRMERIP